MLEIVIVIWGKKYWKVFQNVSMPSIAYSIKRYQEGNQKLNLIKITIWGQKQEKNFFNKIRNQWPYIKFKFKKINIKTTGVPAQTAILQSLIKKNNLKYKLNKYQIFYESKIRYFLNRLFCKKIKKYLNNKSLLTIYRKTKKKITSKAKAIVYVPADMVWSDNFISTICDEYNKGKKALYAIFLRGCEEPLTNIIMTNSKNQSLYRPRNLVSLALRYPHPLTCAHFESSKFFPDHYEYFYKKSGSNIEARCLATTVTMFRFGTVLLDEFFKTKNIGFCNSITLITDSDRMFAISLTPIEKDWEWLLSFPKRNSAVLASWKKIFSNRLFSEIEKIPILFRPYL